MRDYPRNYWTLKFLGGPLDGKEKRYPYCPPRFATDDGSEYKRASVDEQHRKAEYLVRVGR